jgi:hypothetical protein
MSHTSLAQSLSPTVVQRETSAARPLQALRPYWSSVVIRLANAGDRSSLHTLAELDSSPRPSGLTLIGLLHDRPVAALSLEDDTAIADPFAASSGEVLELLKLRAAQVRPDSAARSPRLRWGRRR